MEIEDKDAPFRESGTSNEITNENNEEEYFLKMVAEIIIEIIMNEIDESNRLSEN